MRVAFFAPMKPPHHPTPSGDREMARNLVAAIGANGARVDVVSDLRLQDKQGDPAKQAELRAAAETEAQRLIRDLPADTALWVTYHNYYKAPDLVGPVVCAARNLPYVQIESTRAHSRLTGPWADFAHAAEAATDAAQVVLYLTANDLITLDRERTPTQRLVHFPPFLPATTLPEASVLSGPMLTAGMMRDGDKLASYHIIADTLAHLKTPDWRLDIAGDGPARAQVETLMAPFGDQVRFLGQLDRTALARAYGQASLFLWPGVNEAFGMVYLEAQAAGLPIIAQDRPGVRDILLSGTHPTPKDGAQALATRVDTVLADAALRQSLGTQSREAVARAHLRPAATNRFWQAVTPLLKDSS